MLRFIDFLNVFDDDMNETYFEIYDHHDRELFYGLGVEIPTILKEKEVISISTVDAGCIRIVIHREILSEDDEVTDSWKEYMLSSVYNHVKVNDQNGVYDEYLTVDEFASHMFEEIQTMMDDYMDDHPSVKIHWDTLAGDCQKYVTTCRTSK